MAAERAGRFDRKVTAGLMVVALGLTLGGCGAADTANKRGATATVAPASGESGVPSPEIVGVDAAIAMRAAKIIQLASGNHGKITKPAGMGEAVEVITISAPGGTYNFRLADGSGSVTPQNVVTILAWTGDTQDRLLNQSNIQELNVSDTTGRPTWLITNVYDYGDTVDHYSSDPSTPGATSLGSSDIAQALFLIDQIIQMAESGAQVTTVSRVEFV